MKKIFTIKELENLREKTKEEKEANPRYISVCCSTACRGSGSLDFVNSLKEELEKNELDTEVGILKTGCHGFCERGPLVVIHPERIFYQRVEPKDASVIVKETIVEGKIVDDLVYVDPTTGKRIIHEYDIPFYKKQKRVVFGNNGIIDPTNINDYVCTEGYSAFTKVLSEIPPEDVIGIINKSGLRGRGGAGFPTGRKWEFCRKAEGDTKYIVCNADEGDPGAYMDRSVLEGNPHSVLEGMLIGGYAIGASKGFIYIRTEYPLAVERLSQAIMQAKEYGLVGENIFDTGFNFDIEIREGSGAFVSGEETSLIHAIEGVSPEPRQRPPFPAQSGLWGKPTNINNVETWANVPLIINKGWEWYSNIGTEKSKGTKIFSLVGKINNSGLVEVPMGITLREIIYDIGGGIPGGKKFKAVQTGGPSGGCIPANLIDLPVDYERLAEIGSIMGSGGMVVMDEDTCVVDIAKYFLTFTNDESCGKCTSCREGSEALLEVLTRISEGEGEDGDIAFLQELAEAIKDASQCGLGQTLPNPVLSTLQHFREEYEAHIKYKRCPAAVCKKIISSPCQYICPLGQDVPAYIGYIAKGQFEEAIDIIRKENPLPLVCGRVCHHPCEAKCRAGESGDPIAIRALKRFAADYEIRKGIKPVKPKGPAYNEKVAIIGSGPAGLTCGYYLALQGYEVTIFESLAVAGGMLAVGIPEYRLPKNILDIEIEAIKKAGVTIKTNAKIDNLEDLKKQDYKAIFIAAGAHKGLKMGIPGEDVKGVTDAIEFLRTVNLGKEVELGKHVAVIGGGNAAIDAARTANRMGCEKVQIIYRRTRAEMPSDPEEIDGAIEEGVDIHFLAAPVKVLSKNGRMKGIECIKMRLGDIDKSGRRRPVPVEGSEFSLDLDTLIYAIRQEPDLSFLSSNNKIQISKWNSIMTDPETFVTNEEGIFAGGDVVTGPATVTEAMAAGKIAAQTIHKYLRGEPVVREYKVTRPAVYVDPLKLSEKEMEELLEQKRSSMPVIPESERIGNFKEVHLGLKEEDAMMEARRCLRCDLESRAEIEGKG